MPFSASLVRAPPQSPVRVCWFHRFMNGLVDALESSPWLKAGMQTTPRRTSRVRMRYPAKAVRLMAAQRGTWVMPAARERGNGSRNASAGSRRLRLCASCGVAESRKWSGSLASPARPRIWCACETSRQFPRCKSGPKCVSRNIELKQETIKHPKSSGSTMTRDERKKEKYFANQVLSGLLGRKNIFKRLVDGRMAEGFIGVHDFVQ